MEAKYIFIDEILRDSLIYIDYETLKLPETKLLLDNKFINILSNSKAQLIILFKIQQRLKRDKNSKDERIKANAAEIEKILNNIQKISNKVKVVGSSDDKEDHQQIYNVCYKFIEKRKQVVITNDDSFANEVIKINIQEAVRGFNISVLSIDKRGRLVDWVKRSENDEN